MALLSARREQDKGRNGNDDGLDKAIPFEVPTCQEIFSSGLPEEGMVNILRWSVRGRGCFAQTSAFLMAVYNQHPLQQSLEGP